MKYETHLALKFFNGTNFYAVCNTPKSTPQFQALCVIRSNDPDIFVRYVKENIQILEHKRWRVTK